MMACAPEPTLGKVPTPITWESGLRHTKAGTALPTQRAQALGGGHDPLYIRCCLMRDGAVDVGYHSNRDQHGRGQSGAQARLEMRTYRLPEP